MSLCATAHPLYTGIANIFGASISETAMRPNTRCTAEDAAAAKEALGDVLGTLAATPLGAPAELLADAAEGYVFAKRVGQVVVALGEAQLESLFDQTPQGEAMLTTYFGLLAALAAHPAITVSTFPLKMVAAAVRNSELHVRHPAPFEAALHGLVELVFGRLPRVSDPFVDDVVLAGHISAKFSELDFDDEDDYKDFYGLQRAQVMMAIQELTKLRPLEMMRLCHGKLLDLNTNGAGARCGLKDAAVPAEQIHEAVCRSDA